MGPSFTPEKNVCSKCPIFWSNSNTSLWKLGSKIIQGRLLIEDLRYIYLGFALLSTLLTVHPKLKSLNVMKNWSVTHVSKYMWTDRREVWNSNLDIVGENDVNKFYLLIQKNIRFCAKTIKGSRFLYQHISTLASKRMRIIFFRPFMQHFTTG